MYSPCTDIKTLETSHTLNNYKGGVLALNNHLLDLARFELKSNLILSFLAATFVIFANSLDPDQDPNALSL